MRKRAFLVLFIGIWATFASAQLTYGWTNQVGGPNGQSGRCIAVDASDNVIMIGSTFGNTVFQDGNQSWTMPGLGDYDCYVEKLDPNGNLLWGKNFGTSGFDQCLGVTTDPAGNIFITGHFRGDFYFDNLDTLHSAAGNSDIFILKLNPNGQILWARQFGGLGEDQGISVVTDDDGNLYATGFFNGTMDADPGPDTFLLQSLSLSNTLFLLKLNPEGDFLWAKHLAAAANSGQSVGLHLHIKNNVLYVGGYFYGQVDFNPGPANTILTSQFEDGFIQKFSLSGSLFWAKQIAGSGSERTYSIAVDNQNNLYACGYFSSAVDLDPGPGTLSYTSAGNHDLFVLKLNAQGSFVWGKKAGASGQEQAWSIAVDRLGNSYMTGRFGETVDFDPGPMVNNLTSAGFSDAFVLKLDPNGNFANVAGLGGPHFDYGLSIALDKNETILTSGDFSQTADFNPGQDNAWVTADGFDGYVNKMLQPWDYNGSVYHDVNENLIRDAGEPPLYGVLVEAQNRKAYASTGSAGTFHLYYNLAEDTLRVLPKRPYWIINPPAIALDTTQSGHEVGVIIPVVPDVCLLMVQTRHFVPGSDTRIRIQVSNVGTVPVANLPVHLQIVKHPLGGNFVYESANIPPIFHTDEVFDWVFDTLQIEQTVEIIINFYVPTTAQMGSEFAFSAIAQLDDDVNKSNNGQRLINTIRSSFDPNDKQVFPPEISSNAVDTTVLQYLVRFQNTGNFPATLVVLRDTLSQDLDLSTLQILGASHPYSWRLFGNRVLEFRFDDIQLPDSTSNEPESHGFAAFSIKPKKGLLNGIAVPNRAGIYFDFNEPVITNWATLVVKDLSRIFEPSVGLNVGIFPNPVAASQPFALNLSEINSERIRIRISDANGKVWRNFITPSGQDLISLEGLPTGIYVVIVNAGNQTNAKVLFVIE